MKNLYFFSFIILLITSCDISNEKPIKSDKIAFQKSIVLEIPEPSGIAYDNEFLWIVSDNNKTVYKTDTLGTIISSFKINGEDLEGITIISDSTLAVVLERSRSVIIVSKNGNELDRFSIDLEGDNNLGLEGITFNEKNNHLFVLNEKNPNLVIELDELHKEVTRKEIYFASDFSGICYDSSRDAFWIVSDESQTISLCNYEFDVLEDFKVNIPQMEGIAINNSGDKLYIVSDKAESLYIYKLTK